MSVMLSKRRSSTPKHPRPHDHAKLPQCGRNGNANFSWIKTEDLACLLTDFEMPLYDEALPTPTPPPPPRPYHMEEPPPPTSPESSIGTFLPIVVLRGGIGLSKWILVSTSTAYWRDEEDGGEEEEEEDDDDDDDDDDGAELNNENTMGNSDYPNNNDVAAMEGVVKNGGGGSGCLRRAR